MKLEKFDYKIGHKKTRNEFIILGVLSLVLVITVVLYKTFANFTSSASYNIISGKVASFEETRSEVVAISIGKTNQDDVTATLYNDNALAIEGQGNMKDFTDNDLIGELLDKYISDKVTFSEEETAFINDNEAFMNAMFDFAGRSFMSRDNEALDSVITAHFTDGENQVNTEAVNMTKSLMTKVKNAGFNIETIEILDNVKNIGANAFCLRCVAEAGGKRSNIYSDVYTHYDYTGTLNVKEVFNMVTVEASLDSVGSKATSDIKSDNITITNTVTKIPNDLFAWYGPDVGATYTQTPVNQSQTLTIPDSVKSIGINAFYLYNGKTLNLPSSLESIEEYAFAAYHGDDFTIPNSVTVLKTGVFRDFAGKITMNNCPDSKDFATNATIVDSNNESC